MARVAIFADIHATLAALDQALSLIAREQVDAIYVCGDIVGYGTEPNDCCRRLRELTNCRVVAGNHDWAVVGMTDFSRYNAEAQAVIQQHKATLENDDLEWLRSLPLLIHEQEMSFVHASLVYPEQWKYLMLNVCGVDIPYQDVTKTFRVMMPGTVCFVSHSHQPRLWLQREGGKIEACPLDAELVLGQGDRAVADVGSVSMPRKDKLASFAIYDRERRSLRFVRYHLSIGR